MKLVTEHGKEDGEWLCEFNKLSNSVISSTFDINIQLHLGEILVSVFTFLFMV